MRGCVDNCLFCRYPPLSLYCVENSSEDATKQTGHSSRHQIIDYGVGLLPVLVEFISYQLIVD